MQRMLEAAAGQAAGAPLVAVLGEMLNWAHRPRPAMKSWGGNWLPGPGGRVLLKGGQAEATHAARSGAVMVALAARGGRGRFCDNLGKTAIAARRRRIVQGSRGNRLELLLAALRSGLGGRRPRGRNSERSGLGSVCS